MRCIAIAGQAVAVLTVHQLMQIPLPVYPLWGIIAVLLTINILTYVIIRSRITVGSMGLVLQLLADMVALFGLLYYTGGASNPFTSLFILQVVVAAIILPAVYTWMVAGAAVGLYTLLMFWNIEMPYLHYHPGAFFNLHVQGMWISFVLLSLIISGFAVKMNMIIRRQDALLAEAEKVAAVGALAANAAHELGTPLATLHLLAENLEEEKAAPFFYQLSRCKEIISRITTAGGVARAENGRAVYWGRFIDEIIVRWRKLRPELPVDMFIQPGLSPRIAMDQGLEGAIVNLLNNAAEVSPEGIRCDVAWDGQFLTLAIADNGPGFADSILACAGEIGVSTKPGGMGMGLFLAKNIINRHEGTLTLKNSSEGAVAVMYLPLKRMVV